MKRRKPRQESITMSGVVSDVQDTSIFSWISADGSDAYSIVVSGNFC